MPEESPDEFPRVSEPEYTARIDPEASTDKTTMVRLHDPDGAEVESFRTRGTVHSVLAHPTGAGIARVVDRGRGVEAELVHTKGDIVFKGATSPDASLIFTNRGVLRVDGETPEPKKANQYHPAHKDILRTVSWYRDRYSDGE